MSGHELDLRGIVCPINFVKTKLKLEELASGEELVVLLDPGEPIENVPRSARDEGHKVLSLEREGDYYRVVVKKG
ncbi:MAG: sulfurtransferase TusA family protein [Actinobacteria bacterium]|nr:sulfurtransferase TusA family protein [Actinomycetota bacterium]